MDIVVFLIALLATYRISYFVAEEDGPWAIMDTFRYWVGVRFDDYSNRYGKNAFAEMLVCQYCNSFWIGLAVGALALVQPFVLVPFALSGFRVLLLERK